MTKEEFNKRLKSIKTSKEDMQWVKSMVREMEEAEKEDLAFPFTYEMILQELGEKDK